MRRVIDLAAKAAVAAAFVCSVELFSWRKRRVKPAEERPPRSPACRLRVRRGAERAHAVFAVEGTLDEFAARLLAWSVAQVPPSATVILDLAAAGPIRGGALAICARVFSGGRQVHLRGAGEGHAGLVAAAA